LLADPVHDAAPLVESQDFFECRVDRFGERFRAQDLACFSDFVPGRTARDSWRSVGTRRAPSAALIVTVQKAGKPTVRQVYALAAALCERMGEEFPDSRGAASELIERLRVENGHPAPRLEDAPLRS
jgi:hypothetical protein